MGVSWLLVALKGILAGFEWDLKGIEWLNQPDMVDSKPENWGM